MDISEMVQCLDVIGKLGEVPLLNFPRVWRLAPGNRQVYDEVRILGSVTRAMCALIICHKGSAAGEGKHVSVSKYLVVCSHLAQLLFFFFVATKQLLCGSEQ